MSKIVVVPDMHLKPEIIDKTDRIMQKEQVDEAVFIGDIVDDWGKEANVSLYNETFYKVKEFIQKYPSVYMCYGNHDISYRWRALETGYSDFARETVLAGMKDLEALLPPKHLAFVQRRGNVVFSHAGLMQSFIEEYFPDESKRDIDYMIDSINKMGKQELWRDDSPIWARPQTGNHIPYMIPEMMQVVGHTPVKEPLYKDFVLSVDTFSTHRNGEAYGNKSFVIINSSENYSYSIIS